MVCVGAVKTCVVVGHQGWPGDGGSRGGNCGGGGHDGGRGRSGGGEQRKVASSSSRAAEQQVENDLGLLLPHTQLSGIKQTAGNKGVCATLMLLLCSSSTPFS